MKKLFAAILAVAMVASLSAVSFAVKNPVDGVGLSDGSDSYIGNPDGQGTVKYDDGSYYYPVVGMVGPFSYDTDDKALFDNSTANRGVNNGVYGPVEYGETAYYALIQYNTAALTNKTNNVSIDGLAGKQQLVMDSETVSSLSVKTKWEEGSKLVKSVSIVKKKVCNDDEGTRTLQDDDDKYYPTADELIGADGNSLYDYGYKSGEYYYFVAVALESSTSTSDADIVGTLTLKKSKAPKVDSIDVDVAINADWANSWRNTTSSSAVDCKVTGDTSDIQDSTYYAFKFDYDDEVELGFEDESTFTVDVSGQGKILFYYDTEYNSKIAAKYPLADFNFWNGNGAKFNRVGEFFLDAGDDDGMKFLYQVNSDGTLSAVPGAEYDSSDEGFTFNTRVLGSYVISDMELDLEPAKAPADAAPATPVAPVAPATPVSNPSTGAIA